MRQAAPGGLVLFVLASLVGCGSKGPVTPSVAPEQANEVSVAPTVSEPEPALAEELRPISPSFMRGLEVVWWVADDREGVVGETIASIALRESPLSESLAGDWERAGFRAARITQSELRDLIESLPPHGRVSRDWIGETTNWAELFRPPQEWGRSPERVASLPGRLSPERLRWIGRAWVSPGVGGAELRVDLAPQVYRPRPANRKITLEAPTILPVEREGMLFSALTAELSLGEGDVILITCEKPGRVWGGEAEVREPRGDVIPAEEFDPASGAPRGATPFGPPVEQVRTLGEAMLSARHSELSPTPTRVLIALVPNLPEGFTLLGQ